MPNAPVAVARARGALYDKLVACAVAKDDGVASGEESSRSEEAKSAGRFTCDNGGGGENAGGGGGAGGATGGGAARGCEASGCATGGGAVGLGATGPGGRDAGAGGGTAMLLPAGHA
ncbi:MAG: hypothetical protein IT423_15415 [Pirellulaceae bacterium]|nr:hypothetical protein [Pirellulaceae bacterium]